MIFLDGEFFSEEDAKIPVMDRGFWIGDGAYATLQVHDGVPLFLDLHLSRLMQQCRQLNINPPEVSKEAIDALIVQNNALEGLWRMKILVTGGQSLLMRLPERSYGHLILTLHPYSAPPDVPLRLGVFPYPFSVCHASFKSLAHLNRYYVMEYAHQRGLDDAVTLTEKGVVLEAAFGNLVWIHEKTLFTPDPTLSLHSGVTVSIVIDFLRKAGMEVVGIRSRLEEIPEDASIYRLNTMGGIRPVAEIGERKFPLNSLFLKRVREGYEEVCRGQQRAECPLL